jgi:hypothetical protein
VGVGVANFAVMAFAGVQFFGCAFFKLFREESEFVGGL